MTSWRAGCDESRASGSVGGLRKRIPSEGLRTFSNGVCGGPQRAAGPGPQVETVAAMLDPQLPVVADMLRAVREEITAFLTSLRGHWRKAWSTNPLSAESSGEEARRRRWDLS